MTELLVVGLFVVGLALVVAEALLPGMIIGILGALCIVASVGLAYFHPDLRNPALAVGELVIALVVVPITFMIAIKKTRLNETLDEKAGVTSFAVDFAPLVEKTGEALTDLRPSGIVLIDGKKYDVITPGEMIARGTRVRVAEASGNRIVVRAL
ncbi:MAG: hypothetical protein A3F84_02225 [Candidatus Handelsmanbacteria bacterium RIFCSPLOWO2_12_FULL_64_10]|uniref:Uncharacterized protein n=1 Tax=Handelsmanbacteria sp. (strain RIFCSPLOWO2_12_FULL_64_10) TaxID=1817868 RepID=A0A1F6CLX2_HANXR|nr:MAG: hypothetical protein A3F84_02225 [Candidatus Handelsmanbacteria bacterium RIFCSPLOWO2_12_FULL_64_10]